MADVYLSLGANLGDRAGTLRQAIRDLAALGAVKRVSSLYETDPVGYTDQPTFLNAVVQLETTLEPLDLLSGTAAIEQSHGRQRSFANAPRTLDIDILFYGDRMLAEPVLIVPHPRLAERAFVLVPLVEIVPDLRHPALQVTAREMLSELTDEERAGVRLFAGPDWIESAM
jgi:2-amino-4-hydroxy-6-hydroxymethyldihydropteridine diphosphokinase